MKTLFIDLASHDGLLALCSRETVLASKALEGRTGDHALIPLVEKLLQQAKIDYPELDRIACVIGPGGFTSLRIAVVFCNTLGDQLGIPLSGVHLRDVYRARVKSVKLKVESLELDGDEDCLWVHSTKKDEVFLEEGEEIVHCSLDEAAEKISDQKWIGELLPEHQVQLSEPATLESIESILPALLAGLSYQKKPLEPWYGRGW